MGWHAPAKPVGSLVPCLGTRENSTVTHRMISFSSTTATNLQGALDDLKKRNPLQKPFTNYFRQPLDKVANLRLHQTERSVCFLHDEWDFSRLYIYTLDIAEVQAILHQVSWPPIVVADWISRESSRSEQPLFFDSGFHLHAIYDRLACRNLKREIPAVPGVLATSADLNALHYLLLRVFDKYADHIVGVEELLELITQGQVLVSLDRQGMIDGSVIFRISGQSCNFNFLYSSGSLKVLTQLLAGFYGLLTERHVQFVFGWIRRTRPLVVRLHEWYGWKSDGLVDYIYMR